jgi:hypothetical protein
MREKALEKKKMLKDSSLCYQCNMESKYHERKDGKKVRKGLYYNINKRKEAGTSRSKSESTISKKAYKSLLAGFNEYYLTLSITYLYLFQII